MLDYVALDRSGRRVRGTDAASDSHELRRRLGASGLLLLRARERRRHRSENSPGPSGLIDVTRSLAALVSSGVPLARALQIAQSMTGAGTGGLLRALHARVRRGEALHAAMAAHPDTFGSVYLAMVRAGERSGNLAAALSRLSDYLERQEAIRQRLLGALIYPSLLVLAGSFALALLVFFVLPKFADLLSDTAGGLPPLLELVISVRTIGEQWWPAILAAAAVVIAAGAAYLRTPEGRRAVGRVLLVTPLMGRVRRMVLGARFARMLTTLLGGGAPLLRSLDDIAEGIGDTLAADEVRRLHAEVRGGSELHRALSESRVFPPLVGQLLQIGEETGELGRFAGRAADLLESEADRVMHRLVTIAEPALILAFGAVIGVVAAALLQAIYSVNTGVLS